MADFVQLANSSNFTETLLQAIEDPTTTDALQLSSTTLQKLVRLIGGTVPWGPAVELSQTLSSFCSLIYYCGLPNWFITISPADLDSVLMIRLAHACWWTLRVQLTYRASKCCATFRYSFGKSSGIIIHLHWFVRS